MDVLLKRGTNRALSNYVGTVGELTVGTDDYSVRLMTGETKGGIKLAREDRTIGYSQTFFVNLGFKTDQEVDLIDFFKALKGAGFHSKSFIISFVWNYAGSGYVTDGTIKIRIAGGFLIVGDITYNFEKSWSNAIALYIPNDQFGSSLYILSVTYKENDAINSKKIIKIGS